MDPFGNPIPASASSTGPSKKMLFLGGGLVIAVLLAVVLLLGSGGNDVKPQLRQLSLQLSNLAVLTEESRDKITNQDVSKINSDALLGASTSSAQLATLTSSMKLGKPSNELVAKETDAESQQELEDAAIAGTFNSVYPGILSEKLDSSAILMKQIYNETNDQELKSFLNTTYQNFQNISKQLNELEN